jgi:hypothetical protein
VIGINGLDVPIVQNLQSVQGSGVIDTSLQDHVKIHVLGIQPEDQVPVVYELKFEMLFAQLVNQQLFFFSNNRAKQSDFHVP